MGIMPAKKEATATTPLVQALRKLGDALKAKPRTNLLPDGVEIRHVHPRAQWLRDHVCRTIRRSLERTVTREKALSLAREKALKLTWDDLKRVLMEDFGEYYAVHLAAWAVRRALDAPRADGGRGKNPTNRWPYLYDITGEVGTVGVLRSILDFITGEVETLMALPAPPAMLRKLDELGWDLEGRKPRRPAIPMTAEDELILATLADAYPVAVNQPDLERLTKISRQIISNRLKWLESKRYVKRPKNTKRKGHAITPAGLSAIGRPVESPH